LSATERKTAWQRWLWRPQQVRLRKAIFQIHLWSGVGLGLYVFFISVTGSVLVYRNEMYAAATPASGTYSADDTPLGIQIVSTLLDLHDNLLGGEIGRLVNGAGAIAVFLIAMTGLVIWWPGVRQWRRSLTLRRGVGWKRFTWDLHSAIGFWAFAFIFVFAASGIYLCFPQTVGNVADRIQPLTAENAGERFVDYLLYWLAYLHFGRINGIGIPCSGPGVCDQSVKAVWAFFGLAPAVMFATGSIMWWNRVVKRWRNRWSGR
jgi:uncharacterized iron-regulated membrane protein